MCDFGILSSYSVRRWMSDETTLDSRYLLPLAKHFVGCSVCVCVIVWWRLLWSHTMNECVSTLGPKCFGVAAAAAVSVCWLLIKIMTITASGNGVAGMNCWKFAECWKRWAQLAHWQKILIFNHLWHQLVAYCAFTVHRAHIPHPTSHITHVTYANK